MNPFIELKALIAEMQLQMDGWTNYFSKKTGEFIAISDEEFRAAEAKVNAESEAETEIEYKVISFDVDEERVEIAIDILEDNGDYIELPSKYEIHEYDMMERFCWALENEEDQNILLTAIKGSGAFRRFKDMIRELGLEEDWHAFKGEEYKEIAIEWCNDNEIEYKE